MMLFKVCYGVAMNYVFKKFVNYRCRRYWCIVGCSVLFPFLQMAIMLASFQALGTSPESIDDWKMSCSTGFR